MNFTHYTLGEALSNPNETIKRNAMSILKQLQKEYAHPCEICGGIRDCEARICNNCRPNERYKK